jgi:hypothetical protein
MMRSFLLISVAFSLMASAVGVAWLAFLMGRRLARWARLKRFERAVKRFGDSFEKAGRFDSVPDHHGNDLRR